MLMLNFTKLTADESGTGKPLVVYWCVRVWGGDAKLLHKFEQI